MYSWFGQICEISSVYHHRRAGFFSTNLHPNVIRINVERKSYLTTLCSLTIFPFFLFPAAHQPEQVFCRVVDNVFLRPAISSIPHFSSDLSIALTHKLSIISTRMLGMQESECTLQLGKLAGRGRRGNIAIIGQISFFRRKQGRKRRQYRSGEREEGLVVENKRKHLAKVTNEIPRLAVSSVYCQAAVCMNLEANSTPGIFLHLIRLMRSVGSKKIR